MGYGFNADEIFEIAEQIERNGGAFYRRVAEMISGDDIHKFFTGRYGGKTREGLCGHAF